MGVPVRGCAPAGRARDWLTDQSDRCFLTVRVLATRRYPGPAFDELDDVEVGSLAATKDSVSLRPRNGKVTVTDGPYAETKEHIGGFWMVEAADMDEALAWARKAVVACRVPVEVRGILFRPRNGSQA